MYNPLICLGNVKFTLVVTNILCQSDTVLIWGNIGAKFYLCNKWTAPYRSILIKPNNNQSISQYWLDIVPRYSDRSLVANSENIYTKV